MSISSDEFHEDGEKQQIEQSLKMTHLKRKEIEIHVNWLQLTTCRKWTFKLLKVPLSTDIFEHNTHSNTTIELRGVGTF